jgi:hypothetical protein
MTASPHLSPKLIKVLQSDVRLNNQEAVFPLCQFFEQSKDSYSDDAILAIAEDLLNTGTFHGVDPAWGRWTLALVNPPDQTPDPTTSTLFLIELRADAGENGEAEIIEFLCLRSKLEEAITFCQHFDISGEDTLWQKFAILQCTVDPTQDQVHTANRLVKTIPIPTHQSKAGDLLKFAGTWQGDDLEDCLQSVYDNRSEAEF